MKLVVALCGILLLQCSAIRHEIGTDDLQVEEIESVETQEFMDSCASCATNAAEDPVDCLVNSGGYPMWCYEGDIRQNFAACVNWVSEAAVGIKKCRTQSDPAACMAENNWCKWDKDKIMGGTIVELEDENEDANDPANIVTPGVEKQKSVAAPPSEPEKPDIDPSMDLDSGRLKKEGSSAAQERWQKATKYAKLQAVVKKEIDGLKPEDKKEVLKIEKEMDEACAPTDNVEACCTKQCFPEEQGWLASIWNTVCQGVLWLWEKISWLWGSQTVSCVATCIVSNGPEESRLSML